MVYKINVYIPINYLSIDRYRLEILTAQLCLGILIPSELLEKLGTSECLLRADLQYNNVLLLLH